MDVTEYLRFVAALAFVLALIGVVAWAVRRYGLAGAAVARGHGRTRRLAVVEALTVDAKRRLVLVRRDGVEHLILLGLDNAVLVETGIRPPDAHAATAQEDVQR